MSTNIPTLELSDNAENGFGAIQLKPLSYSHVHSHNFFEFEFAVKGAVHHIINNESTVFRGGDIWFINPTTVHHFYSDEKCPGVERYLILFNANMISDRIWQEIDIRQLPLNLHLEGEEFNILCSHIQALLCIADNGRLPETLFVKWTLEWIILYILNKLPIMSSTPELARFQPALAYVQSHFRENLTLEDVAATVFFSPEHFSRMFHKHYGISFQEYLIQLRISYAYAELCRRDVSVTEVCFASGFNSLEHFSRTFKKKIGMSPTDYHKQFTKA